MAPRIDIRVSIVASRSRDADDAVATIADLMAVQPLSVFNADYKKRCRRCAGLSSAVVIRPIILASLLLRIAISDCYFYRLSADTRCFGASCTHSLAVLVVDAI